MAVPAIALNPELQRNIWQELTPRRLIAAPVILGLVFALFWPGAGESAVSFLNSLETLFVVILLFWGTRRAAAALIDEIQGRTWDGQRLSALGAWSMTWGKLLGGGIFVWYCALIVLLASVVVLARAAPPLTVALYVVAILAVGLFAQAVSLLTALLLLRRARGALGGIVTLAQLAGLLAGALAWSRVGNVADLWPMLGLASGMGPGMGAELGALVQGLADFEWYRLAVDQGFTLLAFLVLLGWTLLGCHRLMRLELQYRARPWAWVAFLAFAVLFLAGFAYSGPQALPPGFRNPLLLPLVALVLLVYLGLLTEPRDWIRQRAFLGALGALDPVRLWAAVPLWGLSLLALALILAPLYLLAPAPQAISGPPEPWRGFLPDLLQLDRSAATLGYLAALLLFLLRDSLLFLLLTLGGAARWGGFAGLVGLACLYGIPIAALATLDLAVLAPVFVPTLTANPLAAVLPVLLQVALLAAGLAWLWRARIAALRAPAGD